MLIKHDADQLNVLRPQVFVDQATRLHQRPADFLAELVRCPTSVGAICASSERLGTRIAKHIALLEEGYVVELGGGTGAITQALLSHGIPADKLIVFEKSSRFAGFLHERFPMVQIVHGDAGDIDAFLAECGNIKAIVSGLPLRSLPTEAVTKITAACRRILRPRAGLIQFTYALHGTSPWAQAGLRKVSSEIVWANLPPARIEVFTNFASS